RRHSGTGGALRSSFGPSVASRRAASSLLSPVAGSTPSRRATSAASVTVGSRSSVGEVVTAPSSVRARGGEGGNVPPARRARCRRDPLLEVGGREPAVAQPGEEVGGALGVEEHGRADVARPVVVVRDRRGADEPAVAGGRAEGERH